MASPKGDHRMAQALFDEYRERPDTAASGNGAATASLVLGLLSMVLLALAGVPAVLAGLIGLARARSRGTGAIRSGVGLTLGLLSVAATVALVQFLLPVYETIRSARQLQSQGLPAADTPQARQAVEQARTVVQEMGVDPQSVTCGRPSPSGSSLRLDCAGSTVQGAPADIDASCPMPALLRGSAACSATVNGQPHRVRVTLRDGVPSVRLE